MSSYIITEDSEQIEIPGIYNETFNIENIDDPVLTAEGTYISDIQFKDKFVCNWRTRANATSNEKFWRLYGYLKGRGWRDEDVYIERLNATLRGYIRIKTINSALIGADKNKKELEIVFIEK